MSFHDHLKHPQYNTPEIVRGLIEHGLDPYQPSQLADAFRLGWVYRNQTVPSRLEMLAEKHMMLIRRFCEIHRDGDKSRFRKFSFMLKVFEKEFPSCVEASTKMYGGK